MDRERGELETSDVGYEEKLKQGWNRINPG